MAREFLRKVDLRRMAREHAVSVVKTRELAAWEKDRTRNPEGLMVVRGRDGKPAELVLREGGSADVLVSDLLVNGQRVAIPQGDIQHDPLTTYSGVQDQFAQPYDVQGTHLFRFTVNKTPYAIYVLIGTPSA